MPREMAAERSLLWPTPWRKTLRAPSRSPSGDLRATRDKDSNRLVNDERRVRPLRGDWGCLGGGLAFRPDFSSDGGEGSDPRGRHADVNPEPGNHANPLRAPADL